MRRPRRPGGGITGAAESNGTLASVAASIPPPGRPSQYRGFVCKAPDGSGIVGELVDSMGWAIRLVGRRGEHKGRAAYLLTGTLGPTPPAWSIPGLDGADG